MSIKKSVSIIFAAVALSVAACCFIFFGGVTETHASTESELAAAKAELSRIQSKSEELERELASAQASKSTQLKAKIILEEQIESLNSEISALNAVISAISADVDAKNAELDELASTYEADMAAFRERARASYGPAICLRLKYFFLPSLFRKCSRVWILSTLWLNMTAR